MKKIQLTKGEVNEFIDFDNDLVFILESQEEYAGSTYNGDEVHGVYYTCVKVCYRYDSDIVVNLTEETKKEVLKLANSYGK